MHLVVVVLAVTILAAIGLTIVLLLRLERPFLQPIAILRAVVQLGILSLMLNGVVASELWTAVFLVVMVGAATWVVVRRLQLGIRDVPAIVITIALSSLVPVAVVFLTGAVEWSPRYLLAVGGIVIGNVMTVCTLMGRSLSALFVSSREEVEGWLALGATPRRASSRLTRVAASTALIPSTDQTRTTGIVTLPGAFVGAIFAGASPLEAAEFQLLVLAAILVAGSLAVAVLGRLFGAPTVLPVEERLRTV